MYTVTREFHFSAAHTIPGHPKCSRVHGHNYKVEVTVGADELDVMGMVMDFGTIDFYVKPLVDQLDHKFIIGTMAEPPKGMDGNSIALISAPRSTVECLTEWFFRQLLDMVEPDCYLVSIRIWETDKSCAEYKP